MGKVYGCSARHAARGPRQLIPAQGIAVAAVRRGARRCGTYVNTTVDFRPCAPSAVDGRRTYAGATVLKRRRNEMYTKTRWLSVAVVVVLAAGVLGSFAQDQKPAPQPAKARLILDVAKHAPDLKTFSKLVVLAGLEDTLKEKGPFTVFAPTDEAFAKLGKEQLADLEKPENKAKLVKILKNHIVDGMHPAAAIEKMASTKTMAGNELPVTAKEGVITVGGAKIVKPNTHADNGVIHSVDTVLTPKE
jgi:uncharacterized surface protein with fasciclin (FAS1) repeats